VLKALRAHDEELGEELDELRRQLGRRGQRPRLPRKIHVDLPTRVGVDFARAFEVRLVEQTTAPWEFWFGLLEKFIERNGDANVPLTCTLDGYNLGGWAITQRHNRAKGALQADRERRLGELTGWTWGFRADRWEQGLSRVLDYVKQNGDALVPVSYTVDGYPLGKWVTVQRVNFIRGTLDADRRQRLEELPGWAWDPYAAQWEQGFSRILEYVDQNGDALVPRSCTVDGYPLGKWVNKQRISYIRGTLDADRRQRLEDLPGWTWDALADRWEQGLSRVLDYVKQNGDALVPYAFTVDGYPLGKWVKKQRGSYANGILDADRRKRLEELPGWTWDPLADQWEQGFSRVLRYIEQNGDALVPYSYTVDGYRLGKWVAKQRANFANGTLEVDRKRRLDDVPGWTWDVRAAAWEEGYNRLLRYIEENGNARVPTSYMLDHYRLGKWVAKQRANFANGTLDADRERRLRDLNGWTWNARSSST
jgi:ribosomal protein L7Ae-like RNA K-turn-binding protein